MENEMDDPKNVTRNENNVIFCIKPVSPGSFNERLTVKTFRHRDDMRRFLCTGANALAWRVVGGDLPTKPGVYAFAGGKWHNVHKLDASVLAHI